MDENMSISNAEMKQKCEVETTYIDNGGATFVTAHAFDAE